MPAQAGINVAKATADLAANQKTIDALMERNNMQAEALEFNALLVKPSAASACTGGAG